MPVELHKKLEKMIENTGFGSVSGFVNFVMRTIVSGGKIEEDKLTDKEIELVRKRLKKLGYLE